MAKTRDHRLSLAAATLLVSVVGTTPAVARHHVHFRARVARATPPETAPARSQPPLDDLYRRRGYGIGGAIFGGDTALAGTCADLRFAEPDTCGRGYGIYGNGLGTRFGH